MMGARSGDVAVAVAVAACCWRCLRLHGASVRLPCGFDFDFCSAAPLPRCLLWQRVATATATATGLLLLLLLLCVVFGGLLLMSVI